jgi:dephospho-CoA kinase
MIVIGLTGSIGMGKSTAAGMFRCLGIPVCDSDAIVHRLLAKDGRVVSVIGAEYEGVVRDGAVDRAKLGAKVFGDSAALARLEAILHPMVYREQKQFLEAAARHHQPFVVLDVPLLYEGGSAVRCDQIIVVSASSLVQAQRVLRRPGMTAERFAATLARQMPDAEKRRRADFVVHTGSGKRETFRRLKKIVKIISPLPGGKWPAAWAGIGRD